MSEQEINVYVIELEQPWENWFGIWRYFQTIDDISGFYVENNKEELIKVDEKNVYEVDTNLPIIEYINFKSKENCLLEFGLNKEESKVFLSLLDKMKIPKHQYDNFMNEMEEGIPFEGGMCFNEALTGLLYD